MDKRLELVLPPEKEWEVTARLFCNDVRASAGLPPSDWSQASDGHKEFFIRLVRRLAGEP